MARKRGKRLEEGKAKLVIVRLLRKGEKSRKEITAELKNDLKIADTKTIWRHLKDLERRGIIKKRKGENSAYLWCLTENTEAIKSLYSDVIIPIIKDMGKEFENRLPSDEKLMIFYDNGQLTLLKVPSQPAPPKVIAFFKDLGSEIKKLEEKLTKHYSPEDKRLIEKAFKEWFEDSVISLSHSSTQPLRR